MTHHCAIYDMNSLYFVVQVADIDVQTSMMIIVMMMMMMMMMMMIMIMMIQIVQSYIFLKEIL